MKIGLLGSRGEQSQGERKVLARKRCQNPPVWMEKEQEKGSSTPLCLQEKAGGAGGRFGGSELHEGLGTEQKRCRPRYPLQGFGGIPTVTEGDRDTSEMPWLDLGWGFFNREVTLREGLRLGREENPQRAPMLKPGLVCFLLEIVWKISLGSLLHGKPFGKKRNNRVKSPSPSPSLSLCVQIIKTSAGESENASSCPAGKRRTGRGGVSLVPTRKIHGKSTTKGPCWHQELDAEGCSECFNNKAFQGKLNTDHNEEEEEDEGGVTLLGAVPPLLRARSWQFKQSEKPQELLLIIYISIYIYISP